MRAERTHDFGTFRAPAGPLRREPSGLSRLLRIVRELNPSGNILNCAHSTDIVVQRLTGANPTAVSHDMAFGGSFPEIATRHGTKFTWHQSLETIFNIVRSGGHGTIALVGFLWGGFSGSSSHILPMGNVDGVVALCEGQDNGTNPPDVISDVYQAKLRYSPTGNDVYGLAIVRWGCPSRSGWDGSHTDPRAVRPTSHRYF